MRVFISIPQQDRGMARIATALTQYCPGEIVHSKRDADFVIFVANGRRDNLWREINDLDIHHKYAVVQICIRSTQKPDTRDWADIWHYASCVWSYYDLPRLVAEDDFDFKFDSFYHAPLGADPSTFRPHPIPKEYVITTTGLSYLSESVRECWRAAKNLDLPVAHIGPIYRDYVNTFYNVPDNVLAQVYSASHWVSGLRRTEGFEMPAVEGLLCGARPIMFDTPDYRHWYSDWANYIYEGTRDHVIQQLMELWSMPCRQVAQVEIAEARERFNWRTIVEGFYDRLL